MCIKVLLADDSDVMLSAIPRILDEEPRIEVVGEASSFASTMQMIADFKPDVLLLDLHLPESRDFTPAFVKSQLVSVKHTVAVSFSNDHEAQELAKSYGAVTLLDKMTLYTDVIPTLLRCEPFADTLHTHNARRLGIHPLTRRSRDNRHGKTI